MRWLSSLGVHTLHRKPKPAIGCCIKRQCISRKIGDEGRLVWLHGRACFLDDTIPSQFSIGCLHCSHICLVTEFNVAGWKERAADTRSLLSGNNSLCNLRPARAGHVFSRFSTAVNGLGLGQWRSCTGIRGSHIGPRRS